MNNHNIATYTLLAEAAYADFSALGLNDDDQKLKQALINLGIVE